MNHYIREELKQKIPVVDFGASDCGENCKSHLLYFNEENVRSKIEALYTNKLRLKSIVIDLAEN